MLRVPDQALVDFGLRGEYGAAFAGVQGLVVREGKDDDIGGGARCRAARTCTQALRRVQHIPGAALAGGGLQRRMGGRHAEYIYSQDGPAVPGGTGTYR